MKQMKHNFLSQKITIIDYFRRFSISLERMRNNSAFTFDQTTQYKAQNCKPIVKPQSERCRPLGYKTALHNGIILQSSYKHTHASVIKHLQDKSLTIFL